MFSAAVELSQDEGEEVRKKELELYMRWSKTRNASDGGQEYLSILPSHLCSTNNVCQADNIECR